MNLKQLPLPTDVNGWKDRTREDLNTLAIKVEEVIAATIKVLDTEDPKLIGDLMTKAIAMQSMATIALNTAWSVGQAYTNSEALKKGKQ